MNGLQYLIAQQGSWSERKKSRAMLLEPTEIPGTDWGITSERSWRSGYIVPHWNSDVARRSRRSGGFASWRSFKQGNTPLGFWSQVSPYGLREDAETAVPRLLSMAYKNPRFKGTEIQEMKVDNLDIPGVEGAYVVERVARGSSKGPSDSKYVVANVAHVVFLLAFYAYGNGWPWNEVSRVAALQAEKIRSVLGEPLG
jgi:hypothetical protein